MALFQKRKEYDPEARRRAAGYRGIIIVGIMLAISFTLLYVKTVENRAALDRFSEKLDLLEAAVFDQSLTGAGSETDETPAAFLGEAPAGTAGYAAFLSLSDGEARARVFHGTGSSLKAAWKAAEKAARSGLVQEATDPLWLKADIAWGAEELSAEALSDALLAAGQDAYRYGLAFDESFETALLEAELNGNRIYDYERGGVSLSYLNSYLGEEAKLSALPEYYVRFSGLGWLCDEYDEVYPLVFAEIPGYGRRQVPELDGAYAAGIAASAAAYLQAQIREDGSFLYGTYPRFDNSITGYSLEHHFDALRALLSAHSLAPDETRREKAALALRYGLEALRYEGEAAYLYDESADECSLAASAAAILAMTDYMQAFGGTEFEEVCRALGAGILAGVNPQTGLFPHVLDGSFALKEAYRASYYDGKAIASLCRLFTLTGDEAFLYSARRAMEALQSAGDAPEADEWLIHAANELAKHVSDPAYDTFALEAVRAVLRGESLTPGDSEAFLSVRPAPWELELLLSAVALYDRVAQGGEVEGLSAERAALYGRIYYCAGRQLDTFFFPEYAMYMQSPARILHAFMEREDGSRVRIDDSARGILAFALYAERYEHLAGTASE